MNHSTPEPMDPIAEYNRVAWDHQVQASNKWTQPVDEATIARARQGDWQVVLTPTKPVPREWFPELHGCRVLCLASGGGQQAPLLAAAGADVTVVDNSPAQLRQDQLVAQREGLSLTTHVGDMRTLRPLSDDDFDLIVHPCSNCFVPEIASVWKQCHRVLRSGGALMAGFLLPYTFMFDEKEVEQKRLVPRFKLPYTDETHLTAAELDGLKQAGEPLMFSHSLTDLLAGQMRVGFQIVDLFEDTDPTTYLSEYFPPFLATLAVKSAG